MSVLLARVSQRDNVLTLPHKTSQIIRPVMDGGPDNSFGERRLMMQLQSAALKEASEAWHLWFEAQQLCNRTQSCSSSHRDKVTTAGVSTWHFSALCGHSICRHSWHSRGPAHSLLTGVRLGYLYCDSGWRSGIFHHISQSKGYIRSCPRYKDSHTSFPEGFWRVFQARWGLNQASKDFNQLCSRSGWSSQSPCENSLKG